MVSESEMREALGLFVTEATDLLAEMETSLLALADEGSDDETLNAVFRAAHTIKGSSGLFGLDHIVDFTHDVETVLDAMRSHRVEVSAELLAALLSCRDHMAAMVDAVGAAPGEQQVPGGAQLLASLADAAAGTAGAPPAAPFPDQAEVPAPACTRVMHVSIRFGPDCLRQGMDPLAFVRYLSTLGTVTSLTTVDDLLPPLDAFDPETCYLGFEVSLQTTASEQEVNDVFEFVRDDSDIRVLPAGSPPAAYQALVASYGAGSARVQALLEGTGAYRPSTQTDVPSADAATADAAGPDAAAADAAGAGAALPRSGPVSDEGRQTIRVDAARLDRLVDAVGELVTAGSGASLRAAASGDEATRAAMEDVMALLQDVRDAALSLRMVPIGRTFSRFRRVVHDVSRQLGKQVDLVVTGAETEVDKALVDMVADPLTHLVRNALDHGIEDSEARLAKGKPARGTLTLNAFHEAGSVVVEVSDDGAGIDTARVLEKAQSSGLVAANAALSDAEVHELIFLPGFSTAGEVSDLSGRGVGMDVVRRNVTAMRGTVEVSSRAGHGTAMRIRIPLTLAIIDGFMVGAGEATFVVPLDRVLECVELPATGSERDCMDLRGSVLPLARLRNLMAVDGPTPRRQSVVVVEDGALRAGLVVDDLKGKQQTVIKPLGPLFSHVPGVGGSSILGNGELALVLDIPGLVRRAITTHRRRERLSA